jgi:hypothetical protein
VSDLPEGFQVPTPRLPRRRPVILTAAASLLVLAGAFTLLGGFVLVGAEEGASVGDLDVGDASRSFGLGAISIGLIEIVTGVQVFRLRRAFRPLAIAVSSLGAVVAALFLAGGDPRQFIWLLVHGFVVFALAISGEAFREPGRG